VSEDRAQLVRRADVERARLVRVIDALVGRKPIAHVVQRAKQIGLPVAAVAVGGASVALALAYRKHRREPHAQLPVYLEIARRVIVSAGTFVLATFAKRYLARLINL
jgi:hypothetical protein